MIDTARRHHNAYSSIQGRRLRQVSWRHAAHADRGEFREVAGRWASEADLGGEGDKLRRELDIEALLVTRSEEGMTLFTESGRHTRTHTSARSVRMSPAPATPSSPHSA